MAKKRDFYDVLGVDRNADADALKKAWRKLRIRFHPDRHDDSEKARVEEQFKEAKEAYEELDDPARRALYDTYGHKGLEQGFVPPARPPSSGRPGGSPLRGGFAGSAEATSLWADIQALQNAAAPVARDARARLKIWSVLQQNAADTRPPDPAADALNVFRVNRPALERTLQGLRKLQQIHAAHTDARADTDSRRSTGNATLQASIRAIDLLNAYHPDATDRFARVRDRFFCGDIAGLPGNISLHERFLDNLDAGRGPQALAELTAQVSFHRPQTQRHAEILQQAADLAALHAQLLPAFNALNEKSCRDWTPGLLQSGRAALQDRLRRPAADPPAAPLAGVTLRGLGVGERDHALSRDWLDPQQNALLDWCARSPHTRGPLDPAMLQAALEADAGPAMPGRLEATLQDAAETAVPSGPPPGPDDQTRTQATLLLDSIAIIEKARVSGPEIHSPLGAFTQIVTAHHVNAARASLGTLQTMMRDGTLPIPPSGWESRQAPRPGTPSSS